MRQQGPESFVVGVTHATEDRTDHVQRSTNGNP
jgi:hypothetical protein